MREVQKEDLAVLTWSSEGQGAESEEEEGDFGNTGDPAKKEGKVGVDDELAAEGKDDEKIDSNGDGGKGKIRILGKGNGNVQNGGEQERDGDKNDGNGRDGERKRENENNENLEQKQNYNTSRDIKKRDEKRGKYKNEVEHKETSEFSINNGLTDDDERRKRENNNNENKEQENDNTNIEINEHEERAENTNASDENDENTEFSEVDKAGKERKGKVPSEEGEEAGSEGVKARLLVGGHDGWEEGRAEEQQLRNSAALFQYNFEVS